MIRLSVTDLDSFLYWKGSEDMEFEELLIRLRGEEPTTDAMSRGRAFHSLFEHSTESDLAAVVIDGWDFQFELDVAIDLPPIRELKGEVVLSTAAGPVTLVGKVDGMAGVTVTDYKLTERFDIERYTDSYQWRSYLTMFKAQRFIYDVFVYREDRRDPRKLIVYDHHRLPFYAYPNMAVDVERTVGELADIVAKHVPQKIVAEAA